MIDYVIITNTNECTGFLPITHYLLKTNDCVSIKNIYLRGLQSIINSDESFYLTE